MNDLLDDNNFFIFDDVNVRISPVSKMPFRKKPRDTMHVRSKSNSKKSLPRTVHKLAEPVAKWFPRIVQDFLWIIDSGCSKHMTDEASEVIISFIKKTQVNLQLQVQRVRTDNGTEFKNKTLAKFFDVAEAIATACFTQNHSIIHKPFDKTPYELINKRKPNIKFFRVFGCRCYLLNDYEDVGKLKAKGDIGVFVGYSKESAAFRI
nr:hypothetical protein [Tanacetum cinerariifolium]